MATEPGGKTLCSAAASQRDVLALCLKVLVLYFVVSMGTLPFVNAIWWGELPALAIPQLPKLFVASWLRTDVVMPAIAALGYSRGSFSPDFVLARPYALALAYLFLCAGLLTAVWLRTRVTRSYRLWTCLLIAAAAADYFLTLKFATQPALTLY
ncbi:MAG: hypothetical protein ACT4PU_01235 [Planctomycetota bacterium]